MAGVFIAPLKEDFDKVTGPMLEQMLDEVCIPEEQENTVVCRLTRTCPKIDVGIMSAPEIFFEVISAGAGPQKVRWCEGRISYNGMLYDELVFDAVTRSTLFAEPSFILYGVTIGIDFHWQRQRNLRYAGQLRFVVDGPNIVAINRIRVENYLLSVISSEMKSSAGLELLKAHAVISRSWLMANLRGKHSLYDVCADDCCQRYQGCSMAAGDDCRRAIDETWGQTLRYGGKLCDARYSKCCGGRTELFSSCWEDVDYPYLQSGGDPWCDCSDEAVLGRVLNDYDLETKDFHDWTVRFSQDELSALVARKTGLRLGRITALEPLQRGPSGRIIRLRIEGTEGSAEIGKELAIRKALSPDCLKSSAFEVQRTEDGGFVLVGRGWGHGVGLCQIGAAVMASEGRSYREILSHYYKGAEVCDD